MFSKLLALTLVLPFVSALTISTPKNLSSGGPATITWTNAAGDPGTFSLELNNEVFHNSFAISNNVQPSSGSITLNLPIVPAGDGYTIIAVAIGDINNVYATSGSFSIAEQGSITTTSSSGGSGSHTSTASHASYSAPGTSSGFGVTNTNKPTTSAGASTVSGSSGSGSSTGTGSSAPASSSTSSTFNAAPSMKFGFYSGTMAAVLLSAVAGAAVVAL